MPVPIRRLNGCGSMPVSVTTIFSARTAPTNWTRRACCVYPAITDVTAEPTQMFHVALDRAQALRTEAYPGNRSLADAYGQAVVALRRAWIACESYGKKVGTSYLEPADRTEMGTAVKLYNHAISGATPAEQAAYYGRVRDIITKLVERGVLHPPKVQLAQLEAVTRRAIEAAQPT